MFQTQQIYDLLFDLAKHRPVFHSEADFQHCLAWEFKCKDPTASIRLEKQVSAFGSSVYLDLLIKSADYELAIELKYKTRACKFDYNNESYSLRDQSAQDTGRHDFLKDIERLERFTLTHPKSQGYAIFLTNDKSYWSEAKKLDAVDSEFRVHEGRIVVGEATWGTKASLGTKLKRETPIQIKGTYPISWRDYSSPGKDRHQQFRYVVVPVIGEKTSSGEIVVSSEPENGDIPLP